MKTRKTRGLSAKLEAVQRRFDRWRKTHRPRSRIGSVCQGARIGFYSRSWSLNSST
jgi:hypothetical protein